ncbi:hypothetical protein LINPERHAP2_LOCUS18044 [Linum perenne]
MSRHGFLILDDAPNWNPVALFLRSIVPRNSFDTLLSRLEASRIIRKRIRVTIEHLWLEASRIIWKRICVTIEHLWCASGRRTMNLNWVSWLKLGSSKLLSERGGSYCHKFLSSYEFQKFDRISDSTIRDSSTPKPRSSISKKWSKIAKQTRVQKS